MNAGSLGCPSGDILEELLVSSQGRVGDHLIRRLVAVLDELIIDLGAGSLKKLALWMGMDPSSLLRLRSGQARPRLGTFVNLCQALEVSPIALLESQKFAWRLLKRDRFRKNPDVNRRVRKKINLIKN
jgi:DNA-binding Xre family transcriptional regulator